MSADETRYMTAPEFAKALGITMEQLYKMTVRQQVRFYQVGKSIQYEWPPAYLTKQ
ncbi:hypothetical protein [Kocuria rosea]|uniref:hypothetical protein n=1 Tax=Kocuria rosea TaxID=1275 RepID=UPI00203F524C|nr:hypothetical protein [Kocuria rosea]